MTVPLPSPGSTLTLQALVTLIHDLDISRLVRPETTADGLPAVRLCGLLRLRGSRRSPWPTLLAEARCPETDDWRRLSPAAERELLSFIRLTGFRPSGDSDNALMCFLRQEAYTRLMAALAGHHIILTGEVSTILALHDTNWSRGMASEIHTTPERRLDYYSIKNCPRDDPETLLYGRRRLPFRLPLADGDSITLHGVRDTLSLCHLLQVLPGLNLRESADRLSAATMAARQLRCWLWQLPYLHDSLRALLTVMTDGHGGQGPFLTRNELTLADHAQFIRRFRFTGEYAPTACTSLLLLAPSPCQVFCDSSNAGMLAILKNVPGMNRGVLRRLRRLPADTLKAWVSTVHNIRKGASADMLTLLVSLATDPLLAPFPRQVVRDILLNIPEMACRRHRHDTETAVQRMVRCISVIRAWCRWHRTLPRTAGGWRRARNRWRAERTQLEHVVDWCLATRPALPKNRHWGALWLAAQHWTESLRVRRDNACWPALLPVELSLLPEGVEEITTGARLNLESLEMSHCVASYQPYCEEGHYAVFSLRLPEERATLGLTRSRTRWKVEQIRGPENNPVSRGAEKLARLIVQAVRTNHPV